MKKRSEDIRTKESPVKKSPASKNKKRWPWKIQKQKLRHLKRKMTKYSQNPHTYTRTHIAAWRGSSNTLQVNFPWRSSIPQSTASVEGHGEPRCADFLNYRGLLSSATKGHFSEPCCCVRRPVGTLLKWPCVNFPVKHAMDGWVRSMEAVQRIMRCKIWISSAQILAWRHSASESSFSSLRRRSHFWNQLYFVPYHSSDSLHRSYWLVNCRGLKPI